MIEQVHPLPEQFKPDDHDSASLGPVAALAGIAISAVCLTALLPVAAAGWALRRSFTACANLFRDPPKPPVIAVHHGSGKTGRLY